MSEPGIPRPAGRAAPALMLCRQCVEYVFEGTVICPHCGRDAKEMGERYREDYLALEIIARLDRAVERRRLEAQQEGSEG